MALSPLLLFVQTADSYQDTFPGANGAAPADWTVSAGTGQILNGKLRLAGPASGTYGTARALRNTPRAALTTGIVTPVEFTTSVANEQYAFFYLRHGGTWGGSAWDPVNAYVLRMIPGLAGTNDFFMQKYAGGVITTVYSSPDSVADFTGVRMIRFEAVDNGNGTTTVRFRVWPATASEQSGWTASWVDSSPLPAGQIGLAAVNGNNATQRPIDFGSPLLITEGSAPAALTAPAVPNTVGAGAYLRTSPNGTDIYKYEVQPDPAVTGTAGQAFLYVPHTKPVGSAAKLVIFSHGFNNDASNVLETLGFGGSVDLVDRMMDAGYVVIAPQYGNTFGNAEAMARMTRANTYLRANWTAPGVGLLGFSMGGGASLTAAARQQFPNILAVNAIASAVDLTRLGSASSSYDVTVPIRTAYGTDAAGLQAATVDYDPAQQPGSDYTGQRIRIVTSSADDYGLRPDALTFLTKIAPYAAQAIDVDASPAEHGDYGQWADPAGTVAWLDAAFAAGPANMATGSLTLGGSATGSATAAATGMIVLGGSGTAAAPSTATGAITLAGSGTAKAGGVANGSVTLAGTTTARAAVTASGSITLGSSATGAGPTATPATAAGTITLGGNATPRAVAVAAGAITIGGTVTGRVVPTAAGVIALGGSAIARAVAAAVGSITLNGLAAATLPPDAHHPHIAVTAAITSVPATAVLTGSGANTATLTTPEPALAEITGGNPATATLTPTVGTATLTSNGASTAALVTAPTSAELQLV